MPKGHMDELYNSKNPLVKLVHIGRLDSIVNLIPKKNRLRILDAGCGEGHLIEKLYRVNSKNLYYGVDIIKVAIEDAKKRCLYAKCELGDISKLKYPDKYFDIVVCSEVLEHIFEYKDVIKELKRVLKSDGYLIIAFPNELNWTISRFLLRRTPIKAPDHVNSFNPTKMKSIVGLKLISQINLPFQLPFFMSLVCLMKFKK
jgi:ubiquinone/menaquinone biosynthesis C-methylase UbiE